MSDIRHLEVTMRPLKWIFKAVIAKLNYSIARIEGQNQAR